VDGAVVVVPHHDMVVIVVVDDGVGVWGFVFVVWMVVFCLPFVVVVGRCGNIIMCLFGEWG